MAITIDGSANTIAGLAVGGLPDGSTDADTLASNAVTNVKVADDAIGVAELSATGTASSSTYLRGDNSWATVSTDPTTTSGTNNFTVADGNLVIGTAGHGVDFSANTQSAVSGVTLGSELLDWYEEGTFTPTIEDWGGEDASQATMGSENGGKYTRIGNVVFINMLAHQTSNSASSNNRAAFYIGGLPFTQDTSTFGTSFHVAASGVSTTTDHFAIDGIQQANSKKVRIYHRNYENGNAGFGPDLPTGQIYVYATFHYRCT